MEGKNNRLIREKSPYLLKHAHNPVEWFTWEKEALAKAKNDNKPIFLSIGYSTCHWCTVMEGESFEDLETAAFLNKHFISIKVDREERPELDSYYMRAVQAMTGGGGWPLSVFLTPDLKPFYGGTYFPKEPRYGMPSFMQVLEFVAKVWKDRREEIVGNAEGVAKAITQQQAAASGEKLGPKTLDEAYTSIVSTFDLEHGGFGGSPKFPVPLTSEFLLLYHFRNQRELALRAVEKTLEVMAAGGIHDHVGGGFHRYATDRIWLVPHFEKMLYDNALLAKLYLEAFQVTGKRSYSDVAKGALGWITGEMRDAQGGFYSAQDADTEEGEGTYYTWTPDELDEVLGREAGSATAQAFGVTKNGNFEDRNILHAVSGGTVEKKWLDSLYRARLRRPRPATDTKVLTSWNGLAISALSLASEVLGGSEYAKRASAAAQFILEKVSRDGRLMRRFAGGEAGLEGTLEDYAFFAQGLVDLFEATSAPRWLREALRLTGLMRELFEDREAGGFYLTEKAEPVRIKEVYDGPTPSGNSVAVNLLIRLAELTGDEEFRASADKALNAFAAELEQQPSAHANLLVALDLASRGMREIVITGKTGVEVRPMIEEAFRTFSPNAVVLVSTSDTHEELSKISKLLEGRKVLSKPRAYVCQNFTCKLPADSVQALRTQLAG
ncbi:MAG: thioredoxin domain-containing protein [archaeon]|nr:MAG: thioredoxin domain-containing protein [archaeon]